MDVAIIEPPPTLRDLIERTARFVSKKGMEMERRMMYCKSFNFLKTTDPFHPFYQLKLTEYRARNQEDGSAQNIQPGAPATDNGVRLYMFPKVSALLNPLPPHRFSLKPPEGVTLLQLGIIKLTAQFVARYGMVFLAELVKRVVMNPQFEFMKETDGRREYFTNLVVAYKRVLSESDAACMETLLKGFFDQLQLDLHAFVGGVDYLTRMENGDSSAYVPPTAQHFSMMSLNPPPQMQPPGMPLKLSSSTQSDLQVPAQNFLNQAPAVVTNIKPRPDVAIIIDETALLVSKEGLEIESLIRDCNVDDTRFSFLKSSHPCHAIYQQKLTEFRESVGNALPNHVTRRSLDWGKYPSNIALVRPLEGITPKELGIMKLTALFVVRYKSHFLAELVQRVKMNPHFEFMRDSDGTRYCFYIQLIRAYGTVLLPSQKTRNKTGVAFMETVLNEGNRAFTETVLNGFFELLQLEMQEEGVEMSMRDVHAFVGGVDYFALMEE